MLTPKTAPEFRKYRTVKDSTESGPFAERNHGINMYGYSRAVIDVAPSESANPNVEVMYWSEEAEQFVAENPQLTKTGLGVGTPYQFEADCRGRIMFVAVNDGIVGAGDKVVISVAGFNAEHPM